MNVPGSVLAENLTRYSASFFEYHADAAIASAQALVPIICELVQPRSVVDVGCGVGAWLAAFRQQGISETVGLDGPYVERSLLQIPESAFQAFDLTQPFTLNRCFDLVISLEVAEHLPAESADGFVASLVRLGPVVLFSAAIPGQGGEHHVNEQWPDYWAQRFLDHGFTVVDAIRPRAWNDTRVAPWYAQNSFFFVSQDHLEALPRLRAAQRDTRPDMLTLVHPRMFAATIAHYRQYTVPSTSVSVLARAMGGLLASRIRHR